MASSNLETPDNLLKLFRDKIKTRGIKGMVGLQRVFNMMDDDNTGTLSMREFAKACKDFKVGISEENVPILFSKFDANGDGTMSYDEFLSTVRGILNPTRSRAIKSAYENLAERCGGRFTVDYVKKIYNASRHLDVIQGRRTEDNVLVEFIETFDAHHNLGGEDPYVSAEEWEDYFHSLSSVTDSDQYFINNLTNVFGIQAGSPGRKEAQEARAQAEKKSQPTQEDFLPSAKPATVYRSGMMSNQNPLCTTLEYYPQVNNATRGLSTGAMFQQP